MCRVGKIVNLFMAACLLSLGFSPRCGSAIDINPDQCCATNPSCHSGENIDARTCCERKANSLAGAFQIAHHSPTENSQLDLEPAIESVALADTISVRASANVPDAPLKFPPRDLVKLKTCFLI